MNDQNPSIESIIENYIFPFKLISKSHVVKRISSLNPNRDELSNALLIGYRQYIKKDGWEATKDSAELMLKKLPGIIYNIRESQKENVKNENL